MYYLNLDKENYLLSVNKVDNGDTAADIDLGDYDLAGIRINAHKWDNGTLVFDEARFEQLKAEESEKEAQREPTQAERIAELEEALNMLLSGGEE